MSMPKPFKHKGFPVVVNDDEIPVPASPESGEQVDVPIEPQSKPEERESKGSLPSNEEQPPVGVDEPKNPDPQAEALQENAQNPKGQDGDKPKEDPFDFMNVLYSGEEGKDVPDSVPPSTTPGSEQDPVIDQQAYQALQAEIEALKKRNKDLEEENEARGVAVATAYNHPFTAHVAKKLEEVGGDPAKVISILSQDMVQPKGYAEQKEDGSYFVPVEQVIKDYMYANRGEMDNEELASAIDDKLAALRSDNPRERSRVKELVSAYREEMAKKEKQAEKRWLEESSKKWDEDWQEQKKRQEEHQKWQLPVLEDPVVAIKSNDTLKTKYKMDDQVAASFAETIEDIAKNRGGLASLFCTFFGNFKHSSDGQSLEFHGLDPDKMLRAAYLIAQPDVLVPGDQQKSYRSYTNSQMMERFKKHMAASASNPSIGNPSRSPIQPNPNAASNATLTRNNNRTANPLAPKPWVPREFAKPVTQ